MEGNNREERKNASRAANWSQWESKSITLHPYSSENKRRWKRTRNMEKEESVEIEKHGSLVVFSALARKKHSHLRE